MIAFTQITVSNCITSLRTIGRLDWKEFVESLSATEKILRKDLSGHYSKMSFSTRDHYRHVVEHIAKRTKKPEEEVANIALGLSVQNHGQGEERKLHIGYYLIDEGRVEAGRGYGLQPPPGESISSGGRNGIRRRSFFGGIATGTSLLLVALLARWYLKSSMAERLRCFFSHCFRRMKLRSVS